MIEFCYCGWIDEQMNALALKLLGIGIKCEMPDLVKWSEYIIGENINLDTFVACVLAADKFTYVLY
jgi:hypothetical protein